jgi:hypothetical protein
VRGPASARYHSLPTTGPFFSTCAGPIHNCVVGRRDSGASPEAGSMSLLLRIAPLVAHWFALLPRRVRRLGDAGMSTAEYAVGTVAAVAFAVVLYRVVRSPAVSAALSSIIQSALHSV